MNSRNYLLAVVLLFCGACTSTNPDAIATGTRPSWMENPSLKYPAMYYITAVGEGDTLSDARNLAAANLAKIFRSDIRVEERVEERYFELIGKKNSYQEKTKFERDVTVGSSMSLVNVRYGSAYRDKTGRVYCLAYINRKKTAEIYLTRLKENNQRISNFVEQAHNADIPTAYAALSAAMAISSGSRILLEQLDIISPAAKKSVRMTYRYDDIGKRYASAAKALTFSINIAGDTNGKVAAAVTELLTKQGFTVVNNGAMKVSGSVTFEETDIGRRNLIFIRYTTTLDVKDGQGTTVASVTKRGREGHVSRKEAQARCTRSIITLINTDFANRIQSYFDSLIKK